MRSDTRLLSTADHDRISTAIATAATTMMSESSCRIAKTSNPLQEGTPMPPRPDGGGAAWTMQRNLYQVPDGGLKAVTAIRNGPHARPRRPKPVRAGRADAAGSRDGGAAAPAGAALAPATPSRGAKA